MKYVKNPSMEYLPIDDENLAIYDPDSGDTHYLDEIGIIILNFLEKELEESELIDNLCQLFDEDRDVISADVHEFLEQLVAKKVVILK